MSSVMLATKCNRCGFKTSEMWVTRNQQGYPALEGIVCGNCGHKNCLTKDWEENQLHAIIPPAEDGNINRFEYSYRDENGKKHTKKMDPKMVEKHFQDNTRG